MSGSAPIQRFRTSQMCCRKGHGKGGGSSEASRGHPEGKRSLRIPFPAVGSTPSPCSATRVGLQRTKLQYKNEVLELKLGFFFQCHRYFLPGLCPSLGFPPSAVTLSGVKEHRERLPPRAPACPRLLLDGIPAPPWGNWFFPMEIFHFPSIFQWIPVSTQGREVKVFEMLWWR